MKWGTKTVHLNHNSIFHNDNDIDIRKFNINKLQIKIHPRSKCDESIIVFVDSYSNTYLTSFIIDINSQSHKKYILKHVYNTSLFHPIIVPPNNIFNISNVIYIKLIQYNGI